MTNIEGKTHLSEGKCITVRFSADIVFCVRDRSIFGRNPARKAAGPDAIKTFIN
jgi:hypothetical protein